MKNKPDDLPEEDLEKVKHETSEDEMEKEVCLIANLLKNTPEESRAYAAYRIIFEAVIWGSGTVFEAIGLLEEARREYTQMQLEICDEEDDV